MVPAASPPARPRGGAIHSFALERESPTPGLQACTIATPAGMDDDARVSTPEQQAGEPADASAGPPPAKRRNPWIWISAGLTIAAVGLLVWALSTRSDLDSTNQELDSTQQELDSTQQQLGSTKEELTSTKQDLDSATQPAEEPQAESDAGKDR